MGLSEPPIDFHGAALCHHHPDGGWTWIRQYEGEPAEIFALRSAEEDLLHARWDAEQRRIERLRAAYDRLCETGPRERRWQVSDRLTEACLRQAETCYRLRDGWRRYVLGALED